jgi:hypothetical protein
LPDGVFSNQKSQFWENLDGLGMENVVIFNGHLEYFTAFWFNLWPFGIVCGHFVYYSPFWYVWTKKSGNPGMQIYVPWWSSKSGA